MQDNNEKSYFERTCEMKKTSSSQNMQQEKFKEKAAKHLAQHRLHQKGAEKSTESWNGRMLRTCALSGIMCGYGKAADSNYLIDR